MRDRSLPAELTDDDLTALVTLTPAEIEDAKAMWKRDAPPQGGALLDAPEFEGEDGG